MPTSRKRPGRGDHLKEEYNFSDGVRGKYVAAVAKGSNVILLEPDVAEVFRTAKAVNEALRSQMGKKSVRRRRASRRSVRR